MKLTAAAAAPAALSWLKSTKTARVLNVFDRACNLVNPAGEVLSMVNSERGLTPFALLVPEAGRLLGAGITDTSLVSFTPGRLRIGALTIAWDEVRLWNPAPDWDALRRFFAEPLSLASLAVEAAAWPSPGSLLELLAAHQPGGRDSTPVTERVWLGAQTLVSGLRGQDSKQVVAGAIGLAGVGGGLTPAGDDFIVGALLAAWAGLYGDTADGLAPGAAEAAAQRTTTLSGAYLRAAARGECSAPWHALFNALVAHQPAARRQAVTQLLAVGHTSGGDGLAGFLAVQLLPAHPLEPVSQ